MSTVLPNLRIGTPLALCSQKVGTPFEHKSYFIQIALDGVHWILRFAAPGGNNSRGRVILETTERQYEANVEKRFPATAEILARLNNVRSATNFSYCLRNSEHLARYIVEGFWHSLQMQRGGQMRKFFEPQSAFDFAFAFNFEPILQPASLPAYPLTFWQRRP